jgi:signal transduction histidine kinase
VINGYSELLRDGAFGALPSSTTLPLEAVEQATRGLDALFSNFLQYAKLEAGVLEVSRQWVEINDLIEDLHRSTILQLGTRAVSFNIDVDGPADGLVTDPGKLLLILRGLLTNAAKFTTAGSVSLRIKPHGDRMHFVVRDTGPGIRPEDINRIFEPFCQLDGSSTRHHSGIGLGLALSRKLAHLLGGGLEVESVVGVGSAFTLWLPGFAVEDESAYRHATAARRQRPRSLPQRRAAAAEGNSP